MLTLGAFSLPALTADGQEFTIRASARYLQNSGAGRIPTARLKLNGVAVATLTPAIVLAVSAIERYVMFTGYLLRLGASSVAGGFEMRYSSELTTSPIVQGRPIATADPIGTAGNTLDLTWQHPSATVGSGHEAQLLSMSVNRTA